MNCSAFAIRTPTPNVAVGTVGSGLAGVEGTTVENALVSVLGPIGSRIVETSLQTFVSL